MPINVCGMRNKVPDEVYLVETTSRSKNWSKGLSPFICGPCELYDGHTSLNMENAWQFSKVYADHVDANDNPTPAYFEWAKVGWADAYAHRYPMGKGKKPLYSWWAGEKLGYVEARKRIYAPLYAESVVRGSAFKKLKELYDNGLNIWLRDFDGYNFRELGMTYQEVIDNPDRKMGHAFVLAMILENQRVWE